MQKRPSYHFFNFTRKEKNGTIFLLFIIGCLIATPFLYSLIFTEKIIDDEKFKDELSSLTLKEPDSTKKIYFKKGSESNFNVNNYHSEKNDVPGTSAPALFYFDPNTLSVAGWKKLGLADKTIATIQNYLSKGGKFRQPGDIKKIWGLHENLAEQLIPFVKLEQPKNSSFQNFTSYEKKDYPKKAITTLDINNADSASYISLPGIGPGYAKRIIKFRDKLGGFYKVEQIAETFGLPDSTFQKIKTYLQVSNENIRKININTATLDELKEHPYIRYQLANAIIQFRTQHGNFSEVDDIRKIMLITDDVFVKISPYLTVR